MSTPRLFRLRHAVESRQDTLDKFEANKDTYISEAKRNSPSLFHHHPVAIDFQLPQTKSNMPNENRQEAYSSKFRECR